MLLEGLVRQLLQGYLGGYVKDFQKEQLKITFWNEEILLENVELILEAFDYLQLPFALKEGRIGKLSIRIPWKKLVMDPIVIILEDVFVCASQRDDQEWSLNEVEKREFAGKKAHLAAAELAKLSRRVCDHQTGQSFMSYITAKILDSIQVSIRNFHVQYSDIQFESPTQVMFGLKFSSLSIMKSNPEGSFVGRVRGNQVNKIVEIKDLGIYSCAIRGVADTMSSGKIEYAKSLCNARFQGHEVDYLLDPFDMSISLLVNKSGKLDNDMPQYSIIADITGLVMSLNEVQLQQILIVSDYLCVSRLREKYWRYHPCISPLSKKPFGWQKMWWKFAQESILSDVRKTLRKTSWKYVVHQLNYRQKYVSLYRTKLDFLRQEQSIDESVLQELEQMEKESDIDAILCYRSSAEHELQEALLRSEPSSNGTTEKLQNNEQPSSSSRGWLNWLSRGVLGAGGTDDSSQFSGVVSDEVVKDIYEATEFQPTILSRENHNPNDKIYSCAIKFSIHQISSTLRRNKTGEEIAKLTLKQGVIKLKLWEDFVTAIASVTSGELANPSENYAVALKMGSFTDISAPELGQCSCRVQLDVSRKREAEMRVKVMVQPLEVTCDMGLFLNIKDFYAVLRSLEFHNELVLSSLNGINDVKSRVLSKAEFIMSRDSKIVWDISIINVAVDVPWKDAILGNSFVAFEMGSVLLSSKCDVESLAPSISEQSSFLKHAIPSHDFLMGFQLKDLYNHFELKVNDIELKLRMSHHPEAISVLEKFCFSMTLACCIIPEESLLKQLEVCVVVSSLRAHFSTSIFTSLAAAVSYLQAMHSRHEALVKSQASNRLPLDSTGHHPFCFTITAKLESWRIHIDLANDGENSSVIILALQNSDVWYCAKDFDECWVCVNELKITTCPLGNEDLSRMLFLSNNQSVTSCTQKDAGVGSGNQTDDFVDRNTFKEACFLLHYEAPKIDSLASHKLNVCLNDAHLNCYPYVFGLLNGFFDSLYSNGASFDGERSLTTTGNAKNSEEVSGFDFERFGFSNFVETGGTSTIPLNDYPFVSIHNSGSLSSLESSLIYSIYDWRKKFNLRHSNGRSPKCTLSKGHKSAHASPLKSTSDMDSLHASGSSGDAKTFLLDITVSGIKVHFHDSSCIVGTIMLPTAKSSFLINDQVMDILFSAEGLILTSSWWTRNVHEFLWGPSLANLSPILNVRVKKGNAQSSSSRLEIHISIQHVCCVLPDEYLAIIIGYFSLPDWSGKQHAFEGHTHMGTENQTLVMYKFEVLDSTLMLPVESRDLQFIKIEMKHLYCSFIEVCTSKDVLNGVPPEYMALLLKLSEQSHCLNIFGRDLFVSWVVFERNGYHSYTSECDNKCKNVSLIAPLSADVWIRIPCGNESTSESLSAATCIMSRICNCHIIADDCHTIDAFWGLLDVINQFSALHDKSRWYACDVLKFFQLKECPAVDGGSFSVSSGMILTETQCSVDNFSIKFYSISDDSALLKPVAEAKAQFRCSVSLINDQLIGLDFSFSTFALYSLLNPLMLVRCNAACSTSAVLDFNFSKSDQKVNEVCFSLPSLDLWFHALEWMEVVNFYNCCRKLANSVTSDAVAAAAASQRSDSENLKQDTAVLIRSENIRINAYFPVRSSKEPENKLAGIHDDRSQSFSSNISEEKHYKYIVVATHSHNSELHMTGIHAKFKGTVEKVTGTVEICHDKNANSWPFFQISHVNVETEIDSRRIEHVKVKMVIQCDRIDFSLSYQILYFWRGVEFSIPQDGPSETVYYLLDLKLQLRKFSLLISDGRWSSSGPLLEVLLRNLQLGTIASGSCSESSLASELEVSYNNNHKVLWESFLEPCEFKINMKRRYENAALLNSFISTDISIASMGQFNLNLTEPLIECVFRTIEMFKDAWSLAGSSDLSENQRLLNPQLMENMCGESYAPYLFQNLTSLPLVYHVFHGMVCSNDYGVSEKKDLKHVEPGESVSIYLDETPEEQLYHYRPGHSSERLGDMQPNGVAHHFMSIQLDGTSISSPPISMDLVGLTYFEVDFSKVSNNLDTGITMDASNYNVSNEEHKAGSTSAFVVPVVFDVSVQRHSKLIRLYSTVILLNSTSVSLELRFDIPFGVSPKILDPIHPGQEFPLPLHLAEAGLMRWRPLGTSYLWSEAHYLSDILRHESRIGFLRSSVCYPSHPSSDPFRCCISVHNFSLASEMPKKSSPLYVNGTSKGPLGSCNGSMYDFAKSNKRIIHRVTLSTPLVVHNYLPETVSMKIESGGLTRAALLSEVETPYHHIDPSHDLSLEITIHGFNPSVVKFPRTETFAAAAKYNGTKFSLSETVVCDSDICQGPIYATVEKNVDAFSGARELFIFVPFLLYNCAGFPLKISDSPKDVKGSSYIVASSYDLIEHEILQKKGLSFISGENLHAGVAASSRNNIISSKKSVGPHLLKFVSSRLSSPGFSKVIREQPGMHDLEDQKITLNNIKNSSSSTQFSSKYSEERNEFGKVKPCMYSPNPVSSLSEIMVQLSMSLPEPLIENLPSSPWSGPFPLVPPGGSTNVLVPQPLTNAAFVISVTSNALAGPFAGRTQAITFQPRYVISNACGKDLCYRQKGTNHSFHLGIGKHAHLHWTDTTRELLLSICFDGPGWQWSSSFLPDHLGDTQVKIQNHVSGELNMIRVEVQNADVSILNEQIVWGLHENSGTNLILLSDDDTCYMPYRIDNFSKERLRIYQQGCENFDTVIQPYTSCRYSWDEPCNPHSLMVEVPGEHVVGLYTLDDLKEHLPLYLPSTSEKPERILLVSIQAEGETKVLSIVDSSCHVLKDIKDPSSLGFKVKGNLEQKQEQDPGYKERLFISFPQVGVSLINSSAQEMLFACAKNITIDLLQSMGQQKLSYQIDYVQIDNQLPTALYPVVLSFDLDRRSNSAGPISRDGITKLKSEGFPSIPSEVSRDPVLNLSVVKWRKEHSSVFSFHYISLRISNFHLKIEQEVILSLLDFYKTGLSRFQNSTLPLFDPDSLYYDMDSSMKCSLNASNHEHVNSRDHHMSVHSFGRGRTSSASLPTVTPIGAPWQQIYLQARRQKKIYVEWLDVEPIKFTLSFSSSPSGESFIHRGLMAVANIEGARISLKKLTINHHMASWESIQEILFRHYTRQLLHEMYKVLGSAGVIGNPLGFARSLGHGIRDFLSLPAKSFLRSPTGLITGVALGTTSLVSNTVYALSDATTQFSKAAHKGIVALTFDDQSVGRNEMPQTILASQSKGVINEVLEGLTGLLQSPIKGAEKHGLPGVLSGIALGVAGLVARPAASILEVTGKTAESIRNRSKHYERGTQCYRVRLPRPVSRELPLRPYSLEEAVGKSALMEAKLKDEILIICKALKQAGKFVVITERLMLIVSCPSLVDIGKVDFPGIPVDLKWVIESEIVLDSVIHVDSDEDVLHIVGSSSDSGLRQNQTRKGGGMTWNNPATPLPLFQTNLELASKEGAENLLRILLGTIELGKAKGWGRQHILHKSSIR